MAASRGLRTNLEITCEVESRWSLRSREHPTVSSGLCQNGDKFLSRREFMDKVRLGIIGLGGMGRINCETIQDIDNLDVTAVCDTNPKHTAFFTGPKFNDSHALITSGEVDAVLIETPHYLHPDISIDALSNKVHVLCDKPIAVHAKEAQRMIDAHTDKNLVFAVMFNLRLTPRYRKMKSLVENGEIGELRRVNWIVTDFFRTYAYYASGGWRATWKGEGGGVLLNQCPHNLDMLTWITGMPNRVTAVVGLGKYHDIEVEDEVTAILEYPNGATGVFVTSTAEAPGTNRFEIVGERGKVVCEDKKIHFTRNETEMWEFSKTTTEGFAMPETWECDIPAPGTAVQHKGMLENFRDAILSGEKLIAPAEEGINGLSVGNAMLLSGISGESVELPLDQDRFEAELNKLIKNSTFQKGKVKELESIAGSFKE